MKRLLALAALALAPALAAGCAGSNNADREEAASGHMAAQAMLTAHYVAAARQAGTPDAEINAVLAQVADATIISEFWITDEQGHVVYTNVPGTGFAFPTDPNADSQAAPFAALLTAQSRLVVQGVRARELDGKEFKYVGAAGVDQPRIVQVGIAGDALR